MKKMITDRKPAERLLRSLEADIWVYNDERIAAGEDLSAELTEARALFESRVSPELYPLFDEVVKLRGSPRIIKEQRRKHSPTAGGAQPRELFQDRAEPQERRTGLTLGEGLAIGAALLLLIVGATTFWVLK